MNIYDYADCMDLELLVRRHQQQNNRWTCSFERVEVCEGTCILRSAYGNSKSPEGAIADYSQQISGKKIKIKDATYANVPVLETTK